MAHRSSFVSVLLLGHGHYTGFLLPSSYDSLRCPSHYIYIYIWPIYMVYLWKMVIFYTYIHTYIYIYIIWMVGGWALPLWKMMEKVGDDIPFPILGKNPIQTTNQHRKSPNLYIFRVHSSFWMIPHNQVLKSQPLVTPGAPHGGIFNAFSASGSRSERCQGSSLERKMGWRTYPAHGSAPPEVHSRSCLIDDYIATLCESYKL